MLHREHGGNVFWVPKAMSSLTFDFKRRDGSADQDCNGGDPSALITCPDMSHDKSIDFWFEKELVKSKEWLICRFLWQLEPGWAAGVLR